MAEELRLEERVGDGAAVDDDEGLVPAVALEVNGLRDALLARAALAGDEHGRPRGGDALHHVEHPAHRLGLSEQLPAALATQLRTQALVLGGEGAFLERRLVDEGAQLVGRERLGHEVVGAPLHGLDGRVDVAVRGHHDDLRAGAFGAWRG